MRSARDAARYGNARQRALGHCVNLLVARDYQEIVSYSFVDRASGKPISAANEDPVMLANPIAAHLNAMRLEPGFPAAWSIASKSM